MNNQRWSCQFGCGKCGDGGEEYVCFFSITIPYDPGAVTRINFDSCPAGGEAKFKLLSSTEILDNEQEAGEAKADEDQSG